MTIISPCLWFPPGMSGVPGRQTEGDFHVDDLGADRAPSIRTLPRASAADGRARLHVRRDGRSRAGVHPAGAAHDLESVERADRRARQQHLYRLPVRRAAGGHAGDLIGRRAVMMSALALYCVASI